MKKIVFFAISLLVLPTLCQAVLLPGRDVLYKRIENADPGFCYAMGDKLAEEGDKLAENLANKNLPETEIVQQVQSAYDKLIQKLENGPRKQSFLTDQKKTKQRLVISILGYVLLPDADQLKDEIKKINSYFYDTAGATLITKLLKKRIKVDEVFMYVNNAWSGFHNAIKEETKKKAYLCFKNKHIEETFYVISQDDGLARTELKLLQKTRFLLLPNAKELEKRLNKRHSGFNHSVGNALISEPTSKK